MMRIAHSWSRLGTATVAGILLLASGCQYRWGAVAHPQIHSLAVGLFANDTQESSATATLRGKLAERVSREPGLELAEPDVADAIIQGRIVTITSRRLARAKMRREEDVKNDSDVYQTALYRLDAVIEYEVRIPGYAKAFIGKRYVTGQTDMGNWPDQQIVRANAIGQALADAATQIMAAVTEAW